MNANQLTLPFLARGNFKILEQARFFEALKQIRFNGQLVLTDSAQHCWLFYFYEGGIAYATGGIHPVRRWVRHLAAYCPQILTRTPELQRDLSGIDSVVFDNCWEHQLLSLWVAQQKIARNQVAQMIRAITTEVLFDISQRSNVTYQVQQDKPLSTQLVLIDTQLAIADVQTLWQVWKTAEVGDYSPNMVPVIKQPGQFRECTPQKISQTLIQLLNGQRTLYDLAVQTKRDVVQITRALLPYIQLGLVELMSIPDLAPPILPLPQRFSISAEPNESLMASLDDNPPTCQTLETLLREAAEQLVSVSDALKAIAILYEKPRDLR